MTKERKLQEWRKSVSDRKTVLKIKQEKYLNCLPRLRYIDHMECPQRKEWLSRYNLWLKKLLF